MNRGDFVSTDGVPGGNTIHLSVDVDNAMMLFQIVDEMRGPIAQIAFTYAEARKIAESILAGTGSPVQ